MQILDSVEDIMSITVGKRVQVWTGFTTSTDTKLFDGYVSEATPDGGIINLTCKDKMWDLVRRNVNTVYESSGPTSGVISAIAEDLIETYGGLTADVVETGTLDSQVIAEFRCDNTDIWERLSALASAVNYQIFYDAENDTVHFEPTGYTSSGLTLTVGEEIYGVPKWTNDTSRMINDLRVDGAVSDTQIRKPNGTGTGLIGTTTGFDTTGITLTKTPESVELIMDASDPPVTVTVGGTKDSTTGHFYYVDRENKIIKPATGTTFTSGHYAIVNYTWLAPSPIHQLNQESIDTYGKFEKQITLTDIKSIADAETRTTEILSKFSEPFLVGELIVENTSDTVLNVGDRVVIVDSISKPNINKELIITTQKIKYPATSQEITVGDESIRLADWQINVESRLKRIEEQLSLKNQDLILEFRDFNIGVTIEPRYRWVTTKNIAGDGLIWGSSDFGILGTAKWSGTANISFVLGNSNASILGTSLLGSQSSEDVDYFIQQYNNYYEEDFIDSDFKDASTDATWANDGEVVFA